MQGVAPEQDLRDDWDEEQPCNVVTRQPALAFVVLDGKYQPHDRDDRNEEEAYFVPK